MSSSSPTTWTKARVTCQLQGGELAKVVDAGTQGALAAWLGTSGTHWLGASERALGSFRWEKDGSVLGELDFATLLEQNKLF